MKKNIALVASKGGHLGQIKLIFTKEVIGENNVILITESEQEEKVKNIFDKDSFLERFKTYHLRKDYLGFNVFRYIFTLAKLIKIFKREKIDIVITDGAQISIPAVIGARMIGIKSVFIDTIIRVKSPNWSARVSYIFANLFFVQHPNMKRKYGKKAKFAGSII